jgi:hypothetical protein
MSQRRGMASRSEVNGHSGWQWERLMRILLFVVLVGATAIVASDRSEARALCPKGKITCYEWCRKYNSSSSTCLSGHPNSCATKIGGNNACVGDRPRS